MIVKFNNVFVKNTKIFTGPMEKKSKYSSYFDKSYDDYYFGEKTYEKAEIKLIEEMVNSYIETPQLLVMSDLSNQLSTSSTAASRLNILMEGVYSACASSALGIYMAALQIELGHFNNVLVTGSSHNLTAERQFRYPIEYGAVKHRTATFTTTAATSILLTSEKTDIKIESVSIGRVIDSQSKNAQDMGSVMSIAAIDTLKMHLDKTGRTPEYYDIILTGDLGMYGLKNVKDYFSEVFNIKLNNIDDCGNMLYEKDDEIIAGGSGISCGPSIMYGYIYNMMKEKKYKKVLYLPTGSLHNVTLVNQKVTIPAVCHGVSFEVVL